MTATTTAPPRHECAVIGCHRPHMAKTLCSLHYSRMELPKLGPWQVVA